MNETTTKKPTKEQVEEFAERCARVFEQLQYMFDSPDETYICISTILTMATNNMQPVDDKIDDSVLTDRLLYLKKVYEMSVEEVTTDYLNQLQEQQFGKAEQSYNDPDDRR